MGGGFAETINDDIRLKEIIEANAALEPIAIEEARTPKEVLEILKRYSILAKNVDGWRAKYEKCSKKSVDEILFGDQYPIIKDVVLLRTDPSEKVFLLPPYVYVFRVSYDAEPEFSGPSSIAVRRSAGDIYRASKTV